jgi:hypothetical protein
LEYCLFPDWLCTKSEVWAAWVQAFAATLAIVAAYVLASRQQRNDARRRTAEAAAARHHAAVMSMQFGEASRNSLHTLAYWALARNQRKMDAEKVVFHDIAAWSELIDVTRLPSDALPAFFHLRALVKHAQAEVGNFDASSWENWRSLFQKHRDAIHDHIRKLAVILNQPEPREPPDDPLTRLASKPQPPQ